MNLLEEFKTKISWMKNIHSDEYKDLIDWFQENVLGEEKND